MSILTIILTILSGISGWLVASFFSREKRVPDAPVEPTRPKHEDNIHEIEKTVYAPSDMSNDDLADWINRNHGSGKGQ